MDKPRSYTNSAFFRSARPKAYKRISYYISVVCSLTRYAFVVAAGAGLLLVSVCSVAAAQSERAPSDTLRLGALRAAAAEQDPRAVQPELLARATRLRLVALRAGQRPQFALNGQATVQNEVAEIPVAVPGQDVPSPPHAQYQVQVESDWTLYDGGRVTRQAAAERARLREEEAGVAVTLYGLRQATTEAFFSALLSEARARTLALTADDLEARLRVLREQVREGAALSAASAALEADLIRVRQQVDEAEAARRTALGVLGELTGVSIDTSDALALPDLGAEVVQALRRLDAAEGRLDGDAAGALVGRPELAQLARTAERLDAEAHVRTAQTRPSLSLFGQAGYGRPSPFNFIADDPSAYALAGVRLRWSIVDWGRAAREAEALRLQARAAKTEAAAFVRQLEREIEDERAHLARLRAALEDDRRAVELRVEALRTARTQLEEGVILPDTYADRLSDLTEARLTLERHRIELAQARVGLLSTLGRYPEQRLLSTETIENPLNFE